MKALMIFIAALTAILLTACGGGGGGSINIPSIEPITIPRIPPTCTDQEVLDNGRCRERIARDCTSVQVFDTTTRTCKRPSNSNDCLSLNVRRPIYDEESGLCVGEIASECRSDMFFDAETSRCKFANTNAECKLIDVRIPIYDQGLGICRATIARDCTGTMPIFDSENGVCVARPVENLPQSACDNGETTGFCINARREYANNYGLANINAQAAYSAGYFGQGVTVAVIDTGMRVTHEDLRDNIVGGRDFVFPGRAITDPGNHGTLVGGVIAATRGSGGTHGVAPGAKIMPLKLGDDDGDFVGNPLDAIDYAANSGVHIVNNSYASSFYSKVGDTGRYLQTPGIGQPLIEGVFQAYSSANAIFNDIRNRDIVLVWAAGNDGWNTESGMINICSSEPTTEMECPNVVEKIPYERLIHTDELINLGIEDQLTSLESALPLYLNNNFDGHLSTFNDIIEARDNNFEQMTERWLSVVALDENDRVASYSNGCGLAVYWCISAPGSRIYGSGATSDSDYYSASGTSFAAPHVSGALAIIKSAIPEMPMSVARFVLLTTATRMGVGRLNYLYGHGALNLEAALDRVADMQTPNISGLAAIPFAALRQELPARYDYLPNRLQGVSVAIQITDDSYYNVGLSDMISAEEKESDIGDGAAEILRPAATDSPPGFFAYGDINSQIGMRYVGNISGVSFMSDIRHTATDTDFVGGDLGVLGAIDGKSNAGEIQFRRYLNDNFAVFGGYEYLDINATVDEGHLISAIDNVRADGYNVGFSFGNLWRFGDQFSLSAKQKTALSDGELTIRYPHAIGNLHAAFYGNRQNIEIREATISLRQKTPIILTAGYRQPLNAKSEWAAALEYNGKAAAMSLQYKGEF